MPDTKGDIIMDLKQIVKDVVLSKVCSIRADEDSTEKKNINLRINFDGALLQSVFDKAVSSAVITWQNGVGRKQFDTFKNGQTVDIQFIAPATRAQIDPETAMVAKLQSMTAEEQKAYIAEMMAKVSK